MKSGQEGCKPGVQVSSLAGTMTPRVPNVPTAFEHEIVKAHEENDAVANGGTHADRKGPRWRLGDKGIPKGGGKEGVPMVVVGDVACDGSGFHAPSLQTTTERQNVIGEAEGLVGRTGPGHVMPVALEIHTCESDQ